MNPVITGISAWQYWCTPPIISEVEVPEGVLTAPYPAGVGLPSELLRLRANAREADVLVAGRIGRDCKAIDLPVHVMVDVQAGRRASALTIPHARADWLERTDVIDIGGGFSVTTPCATLLTLSQTMGPVEVALLIMEAAGIFAIWNETAVASYVLNALMTEGLVGKEVQQARRDHIREFYDARGKRVSFRGRRGGEIAWELSFDRFGKPTDLWKRAPLLDVESVKRFALSKSGAKGAKTLFRAAKIAVDGSGSPLESKALILMCSSPRVGGEGWPVPWVNRRVDLSPEARALSKQTYSVCDQLWLEAGIDIEVNGLGFHADREGFLVKSGRTAGLEQMGYEVLDINDGQMRDLEKWDARISAIARRLSLRTRPRTPAFLKHREELNATLFPKRGKRR